MRIITAFKLWFFYVLAFVPGVPRIGRLKDAVCIFIQSFGRNALDDDILGRVIWGIREHTDHDDLSSFLELKRKKFDPGDSNYAIARHVMRLADRFSIPVMGQWETIYAMWELDPEWYQANRARIDCIWPPREGYFATYHVKEMSHEAMRQRRLSGRPLEVAHPAMAARAIPILWKLGLSPIVEPVSLWSFWKHPLWVWDKNSIQPWTRSFVSWIPREMVSRILHVVMQFLPERVHDMIPRGIRIKLPGRWIALLPVRSSSKFDG